jgi:hypothetical protein
MKKFTLLLVIALLGLNGWSQLPSIEWQKTLGGTGDDEAKSILQTADGGYIVVGRSYSNDGDVTGNSTNFGAWLVKLSSAGILEWQSILGDYSEIYSIQQTTDGGYIIAGKTNSTIGELSGNHGGSDVWIAKLSNIGGIQWQKALGGTGYDIANSIQPTPDSGYVVVGYTNSNNGDVSGNHGGGDYWFVKLSNTGTIEWQKTLGGTNSDFAYSIALSTDGGYVVTGYTFSNNGDVVGNHGNEDVWVVKLSNIGIIEWQKTLGGTSTDWAYKILTTTDGGYIVSGSTWSTNGDVTINQGQGDVWIVKLSNTGVIQWQKSHGGLSRDEGLCIQQTNDGGYVVVGESNSNSIDITGNHGGDDIWLEKLSSSGDLQWQKSFGGTNMDWVYDIKSTLDGGFIMAGFTSSTDGDVTGNLGGEDFWVVKLLTAPLEITSFNNTTVNIFPNPAASILTIQTSNNQLIDKITITDLTGKVVLEKNNTNNQVNIQELSNGMYILKSTLNQETFFNKFLKN